MPSSSTDGFERIVGLMDPSLQQVTLERRALSEVRDIEEAPHFRLGPRNLVLREDKDDFEDVDHLSHSKDSSDTMSPRLAPRYLPPHRREPGRVLAGRNPFERSRHENTFRFQTPTINDDSGEVGTLERHAGPGRSIASQRREPTLTVRFRAPPPHSNQTSALATAAPQSISRRSQYHSYWPLGNTAPHVNRPSNTASRASTINPAPETPNN
jgi:hypothetical protein